MLLQLTRKFSTVARYAFAVLAVIFASILRVALAPALGAGVPFILFYPTVVLTAWFGGLWPGLLSTVLGALIAWYAFIPPYQSFTVADPTAPTQLIIFLLSSTFISLLAESLHQAMRSAQEGEFREREQREQFRVTLASIGDAVIATDAQGRVTFMNQVAESLTGWTFREASSRPLDEVFKIVNEQTRQSVENPALRALEQGLIVGLANHTVLIAKNGTERAIDDSAAPIHTAETGITGAVLVFRDITQRRAAERALTEQARLLDLSTDAIIVRDAQNRVTYWNNGAEETYGYTRDEALGKVIYDLLKTEFPEPVAQILEALHRDLRWEGELKHTRSDGARIVTFSRWALNRDAQGRPTTILETSNDITQRNQAEQELHEIEEQLRRFNEELESKVANRTAELAQTNQELLHILAEREKLQEQLRQAQKMEVIGALAGGVAHDFNNLLNIIQAYALILSEYGAENKEIAESVTVIIENVQRGSALVQQLLTVARKNLGTALESVNANIPVDGLIPLIRETFPKTIELSVALEADLPPILMDRNQIDQALLNLCVNARDAMPNGGRLTFKTQSVDGATLEGLGGAREGRYVCIEVCDTGIGIDERIRERIFEPFFTTKEKSQGTGLGLSVVYGTVKNHNGFIDVESKPMSGTSFRLYFPITPAQGSAREPVVTVVAQATPISNRAATVFLIEDEERMLYLLEKVLSRHGYNVLKATDGKTAVEVYQRHKEKIDVVLLDMGLPKLAGRDVLLKINSENPEVKVIITSGYIEPEMKMEIEDARVRFLHKPYKLDDMVKTLQSLIEGAS